MISKKNDSGLASLSTAFRGIQKKSEPKVGDLVKLAIDDVISHAQVRKRFRKIDELAASIQEEGLQVPINVAPKNADGKYVIIQGERRWRACKKAGLTHIDCIIKEKPEKEQDRIFAQITENVQRDDMDPVEMAIAFKQLRDQGMKVKDISQRLGKSDYYVSAFLPLATLPKEVEELKVRLGIHDPWILNPLRVMFEKDPVKAGDMVEAMLSQGYELSRTIVNGLKEQILNKPTSEVQTRKAVEIPSKSQDTKPANPVKETQEVTVEKEPEPKVENIPDTGAVIKNEERSYKSVPRGASVTDNPIRVGVLVMLPGSTKPVSGFIAPDLIADDPTNVCVISEGVAYVLPAHEVVLAGVETI